MLNPYSDCARDPTVSNRRMAVRRVLMMFGLRYYVTARGVDHCSSVIKTRGLFFGCFDISHRDPDLINHQDQNDQNLPSKIHKAKYRQFRKVY